MVIMEPVGPVAGFSPWNFPVTQAVRKIAAALAAGCSIIGTCPQPGSSSVAHRPPTPPAIARTCASVPYSSSSPWIATTTPHDAMVARCDCSFEQCGSLTARIVRNRDLVTWDEFRHTSDSIAPTRSLGEASFTFDADEYDAAVLGRGDPSPWEPISEEVARYESSAGTEPSALVGESWMILWTIGARSGSVRKTPLVRIADGAGRYAVIGSQGGAPKSRQSFAPLAGIAPVLSNTPSSRMFAMDGPSVPMRSHMK